MKKEVTKLYQKSSEKSYIVTKFSTKIASLIKFPSECIITYTKDCNLIENFEIHYWMQKRTFLCLVMWSRKFSEQLALENLSLIGHFFSRFARENFNQEIKVTTVAYTIFFASPGAKRMDNGGFDPPTSRMLSVRSTNWAKRPFRQDWIVIIWCQCRPYSGI